MPENVVFEMDEQDHHLIHQLIQQLEKVTNDHEQRIRFLERILSLSIGGATVVYWVLQKLGDM